MVATGNFEKSMGATGNFEKSMGAIAATDPT